MVSVHTSGPAHSSGLHPSGQALGLLLMHVFLRVELLALGNGGAGGLPVASIPSIPFELVEISSTTL